MKIIRKGFLAALLVGIQVAVAQERSTPVSDTIRMYEGRLLMVYYRHPADTISLGVALQPIRLGKFTPLSSPEVSGGLGTRKDTLTFLRGDTIYQLHCPLLLDAWLNGRQIAFSELVVVPHVDTSFITEGDRISNRLLVSWPLTFLRDNSKGFSLATYTPLEGLRVRFYKLTYYGNKSRSKTNNKTRTKN